MTRKTAFRAHRWLWALLLLAPVLVAHAESGDPLAIMREIPNRAAKGDRLPIAYPPEVAWGVLPAQPTVREGHQVHETKHVLP